MVSLKSVEFFLIYGCNNGEQSTDTLLNHLKNVSYYLELSRITYSCLEPVPPPKKKLHSLVPLVYSFYEWILNTFLFEFYKNILSCSVLFLGSYAAT